MPHLLRWICFVVAALTVVPAEQAFSQTPGTASHVPGQLLIGFQSPADRESLLNQLDQAKEGIRAGGERPSDVVVARRGESGMIIKIEYPANLRERMRGDPNAELAVLREIAGQLKASNNKITYAHPNWIRRLNPPAPPSDSPLKPQTEQRTPDSAPTAGMPNDPAFRDGRHWHYQAPPTGMNAVNAWKAGFTGSKRVIVAVVDTGIVFDHPDIKNWGNVLPGQNLVSFDFDGHSTPRQGDATDPGDACAEKTDSWHGTHVAGTIGAVGTDNGISVAGINWNVTVLPVRVLGPCGGSDDDIADGMRWAAGLPVEGVEDNKNPADVINLSLGGPGSCEPDGEAGHFFEAVSEVLKKGKVLVMAAGNENDDVKKHVPASCPGVISVAASDRDGKLAFYSNFGNVSIMAPGGDVRDYAGRDGKPIPGSGLKDGVFSVVKVTTKNSDGVAAYNGTSMAAPHVTGAIALALAKHPEWRGHPDLIAQKLRQSVAPLPRAACAKPCGPGLLDVMKLLNQ